MSGAMTRDLDRRDFLKGSAGLAFAIGASGLVAACGKPGMEASAALAPSIWLSIATDGTVTIQYPATEMGQGTMTALPLVLAEELDADWNKVRVETVRIHDTRYGNPIFGNILYTAGSATVEGYYDRMRKAGAQARRILIDAAAGHWKVPASRLVTEPGAVVDPETGARLDYGAIAAFATIPDPLPEIGETDYKPRERYRLVGKDTPRIDIPAKARGTAEYGMDVELPGMVYGAVLRAPVEGERALEIDDGAARAIPGVTDIVPLDDGVGVVGTSVEAVFAAKAALKVRWSTESPFRQYDSESTLADYLDQARDLSKAGIRWRDEGDIGAAFEGAARVLEASYLSDYVYHAQMEPVAATARVSDAGDAAEIWVGSQTQSLTILGAAQALGTTPDRITLHPLYLGGGFGRRSFLRQRYVDDALFLSKAVKKPVKVIWTREDDLRYGTFRPAAAQHLRAALDAEGRIIGWHHRVAVPSVIAFMNAIRWKQAGGKDIISMNGADSRMYDVPNFLAEHVMTERRARVCAWRGVATSYTRFAVEAFLDEIATATGRDPLDLRLDLCRKAPRAQAVLRRVAEMADWHAPRPDGRALGLAFSAYKASASAGIAEVSLDRDSGQIRVHRYWLAGDAGLVIAPRNARAQLESNIVYGLSSSLMERVTIRGGEVEQSNFHDYPLLRMADLPEIAVDFVDSGAPPTGLGELGLATVPGAIANAVARLTGKRLRRLTFTPEAVRAALEA